MRSAISVLQDYDTSAAEKILVRMMILKFLYKLERKYGKYAIKNLSLIIIICFSIGYILSIFMPELYAKVVFSPYHIFVEHEYWRIFTWILTTPGGFDFFTLIMLFFYYSIGNSIERAIGTFMYNMYIFGGMLLSTVGALIASAICYYGINDVNDAVAFLEGSLTGYMMTYYMTISIFLGFALAYQDAMVMLWFVIPFKVKYLAYIDLLLLAYEFVVNDNIISRVTIVSCVLNFFIFYIIVKKYNGRQRPTVAQMKRKHAYKKKVREAEKVIQMPAGISRHKCAVCGRSEKDDENLEFRFCSKCNGNYEYCKEHLFTHEHVK